MTWEPKPRTADLAIFKAYVVATALVILLAVFGLAVALACV